jgi:hypothetical protein
MFSHFITIWFLLSAVSHKPSEGKVLYFDIYMKDSMVGTLRAAIDPMGPQTQYSSDTSVKVKVLKKLKVDYEYLVTYEDGYLFESNVDVLVNEKPHAEAYTKWNGTEYRIIKNGKKELSFNDKVPYSTILLFFRNLPGSNIVILKWMAASTPSSHWVTIAIKKSIQREGRISTVTKTVS